MLRQSLKLNEKFLVNTKRMQIVSFASERYTTLCSGCGKTVDLATFAEASEIVNANIDEIINRVASGAVHVVIRPEALLVCLDSLLGVANFGLPQQTVVYRAEKRRTETVKRALKDKTGNVPTSDETKKAMIQYSQGKKIYDEM